MAEYQNIFNQVQVQGPPELGLDNGEGLAADRIGTPFYSTLMGWIGNAQIGPIKLGWFGVISLVTGMLWFNMWASTCWPRWVGRFLSLSGNSSGWHLSRPHRNMASPCHLWMTGDGM